MPSLITLWRLNNVQDVFVTFYWCLKVDDGMILNADLPVIYHWVHCYINVYIISNILHFKYNSHNPWFFWHKIYFSIKNKTIFISNIHITKILTKWLHIFHDFWQENMACTKGDYWNSFIPKYKWPIWYLQISQNIQVFKCNSWFFLGVKIVLFFIRNWSKEPENTTMKENQPPKESKEFFLQNSCISCPNFLRLSPQNVEFCMNRSCIYLCQFISHNTYSTVHLSNILSHFY